MVVEPKKKNEKERLFRTGIISKPVKQDGGSMAALIWPYVDKLLKEIFDVE
jgi:hypothetical protein